MARRTNETGPARGARLAAVAMVAGMLAAAAPAAGQQATPTVPAGTPIVLLPVQSVHPTPGGAWPGGVVSEEAAREAIEAELAFAFGEAGAEEWVMPGEVVERARRNPLARVNPRRLAYQGLIAKPDPRAQLYEPLHSQLRVLGAMFGARVVALPLALGYQPGLPVEEDAPARAGDPAAEKAAGDSGASVSAAPGRATLLLAVVDTRRSAVLWHGTIEGDPAAAGSSLALTSLALRAATLLAQ